jgi:hypothetical protein
LAPPLAAGRPFYDNDPRTKVERFHQKVPLEAFCGLTADGSHRIDDARDR